MPVEIAYLDGGKGVEFKAVGRVTGREIIEANEKVYAEESLQNLRYQLVDRTECTEYLVSSAEMRQISEQEIQVSKINPNITILLVASSPYQFGMTRMYQAMSQESGFEMVIFEDRQSANDYVLKNFSSG